MNNGNYFTKEWALENADIEFVIGLNSDFPPANNIPFIIFFISYVPINRYF